MVRTVPAGNVATWAGLTFGALISTGVMVALVSVSTGHVTGHGRGLLGLTIFLAVLGLGSALRAALDAADREKEEEEPVPPELDFFV